MADDIQSERFGESVANEPRGSNVLEALPVGGDSPYTPAGNATATYESEKKGCGCWVWGCAGLMVCSLLLMAGLGFGGYWFYTKQVEKYTDTEPADIPAVEMEEEEIKRLQERIESFSERIVPGEPDGELVDSDDAEGLGDAEGQPAEIPMELVLTADEINALIHSDESLRGKIHVVIEDGNIRGEVSFPLDEIPGGKGRYFNADAELEVWMERGILVVKLVDATVKGEPLPDAFMEGMKEQNFAKDIYNNPDTARILRRIDSIEVIDDAIHIRLLEDEEEDEDAKSEAEADGGAGAVESTGVEDASAEGERSREPSEEAPVEAPLPF